MNKERRKEIDALIKDVEALKENAEALKDAMDAIKDEAARLAEEAQRVLEDENASREAMPEGLHGSDRYTDSEAASEELDSAMTTLGEFEDLGLPDLDSVITALDQAKA